MLSAEDGVSINYLLSAGDIDKLLLISRRWVFINYLLLQTRLSVENEMRY